MIKLSVLLNLLACVLAEVTYTEAQKALPSKFPYMVSFSVESLFEDTHFCSAAIIHPEWAVTTADCVFRKGLGRPILRAGSGTLKSGRANDVVAMVVHPLYGKIGDSSINDIALLRIQGPFEPAENTAPVGIAEGSEQGGCVVLGWGLERSKDSETHLQAVGVAILPNQDCYKGYSGPENICAAGQSQCFGDSGGPLVCENGLVGLVSRGAKGCYGDPNAFTNVEHHRDWINFVIDGKLVD